MAIVLGRKPGGSGGGGGAPSGPAGGSLAGTYPNPTIQSPLAQDLEFDGDVGFYGTTPVAQQAEPVTIGDVVALLQAYGLSA